MGIVINKSVRSYFSLSKDDEINKPTAKSEFGKAFICSNSPLEVDLTVYMTLCPIT